MLCAHCGGSMRSLAAFCPTCGHPVEGRDAPVEAAELEPAPQPPPTVARRPGRRGAFLAVGAAVVVAGLGAVVLRPGPPARLAIQVTPDQTFSVLVARTADGEAARYDGADVITLAPGDYFVDVVPGSRAYQQKRIKVHLSGNQMLALPIVLAPSSVRP